MQKFSNVTIRQRRVASYLDNATFALDGEQFDKDFVIATDAKTYFTKPNWKDLVSEHVDATNDYNLLVHEAKPYFIKGRTYYKQFGRTFQGKETLIHAQRGLMSLTPVFDDTLRDIALARFKRKLSGYQNQFKALAPLAELRELRGLLSQVTFAGVEMMKALIDIKKTRGASAFRFASDVWLGFGFGIAPTIADITDVLAVLRAKLGDDHFVKLAGVAKKVWMSGETVNDPNFGPLGASLVVQTYVTHSLSYKYLGGFSTKMLAGNSYDDVRETWGLTLEELPSVAWELIPFSWAFDYFTNVGAFLDDTFVIPEGSTTYINLLTKYEQYQTLTPSYKRNNNTVLVSVELCRPGSVHTVSFDRKKVSSLPHVSLRLRSIDEIGRNAMTKLLNLGSVLIQSKK